MPKTTILLCAITLFFSTSAMASQDAEGVTELPRATLPELAHERVPFVPQQVARDHERLRVAASLNFPFSAPAALSTTIAPHIDVAFRAYYDPPRLYPADAAGAVGPHHVVSVTNNGITVHDRAGKLLLSVFPEQFWSEPTGALFDPRAAYDETADRFIVTSLVDYSLTNPYMLVAVSASGDPVGTWRRFKIAASAANNIGIDLDFASIALTADTIVASAHYYTGDFWDSTEAFLLPKLDAYSATAPVSATRIRGGEALEQLTPVDSDDTVVRFVSNGNAGGPSLQLWEVSGGSLTPKDLWQSTYSVIGNFVGTQLGSGTIVDIGAEDFSMARLRGNTLWALEEHLGNAIVWKAPLSDTKAQTTVIGDSSGNSAYAFASMAVTRDGAVLVAYAVFNSSAYISSAYTYIDSFGNKSAQVGIKDGEGPYRFDRWGDFTTTVVDPVDHASFWTVQIYPMRHPSSTTLYVWATWWSHVTMVGNRSRAVRH